MIGSGCQRGAHLLSGTLEDRREQREVDRKTTGRKKGEENRVYRNTVIDYFGISNPLNRVRHDSDEIRTL
jgi:hypothetical protein